MEFDDVGSVTNEKKPGPLIEFVTYKDGPSPSSAPAKE